VSTLALSVGLANLAQAGIGVVSEVGGPFVGTLGAEFNNPRGVAVNETGAGGTGAGDVFVVDGFNNRIQQLDSDGAFVQAFGYDVVQPGGNGDLGVDFEVCTVASECQAGTAAGLGGALNEPQGIAIDQSDGSVYVTEAASSRVTKFTVAGGTPSFDRAWGWDVVTGGITTFEVCTVATECTVGSPGAEAGQFDTMIGYPAVHPGNGDVYVADSANQRVQRFQSDGDFSYAFGWDVDPAGGSGQLERCAAACQAGTAGAGLGQFSAQGPTRVAVDSTGVTYTVESVISGFGNVLRVQRFNATNTSASNFAPGVLQGGQPVGANGADGPTDVQVNPSNGNVYVAMGAGILLPAPNERRILELDPAGNLLATHGEGDGMPVGTGFGLAVNGSVGRLYATAEHRVFILRRLADPIATIDPVTGVTGTTATFSGSVDPTGYETGYHFEYVDDDDFQATGFANADRVPLPDDSTGAGEGAVPVMENATELVGSTLYHVRLVATKRYLGGAVAATDASVPVTFTTDPAAPRVKDVTAQGVTDTQAILTASVNPAGQDTTWHFEYVDDAEFQANGYVNAISTPVPAADGGQGSEDFVAARKLTGLSPATTYHFRLVATNTSGTTESPDATFSTYPDQSVPPDCPNASIRTAQGSTHLPDCRAYELVSPADANGLFLGSDATSNGIFPTSLVSPSGDSAVFFTPVGEIPGFDTSGNHVAYRSIRGTSGWATGSISPTGGQAVTPEPGGISSNHEYGVWRIRSLGGSLDLPGTPDDYYLRHPGGAFDLVGQGSLADEPGAEPKWVTPDRSHLIFATGLEESPAVQLEPNAPESGIRAIYDRTPDGTTHVVSLLPGDVVPTANSSYRGASADGSTVVFKVGGNFAGNGGAMYVRRNNSVTHLISPQIGAAFSDNPKYAGISDDGDTVFYFHRTALPYGNLFAFDVDSQTSHLIAGNDSATPVNISADGSHVYFVSTEQLDGANGTLGADNLYVWDGANIRFIAEVAHADLEGFYGSGEVHLAQWVESLRLGPGLSPTRSTPDGSVLVFESHAELTGYESDGHSQVFRYDADVDDLECLSCSPVGAPAASDAALRPDTAVNLPTLRVNVLRNVSGDGGTVFFHTADPLVPGDANGETDVYEWKEGDVSLISSGRSSSGSYLTGMSTDGSSVFFKTNETLVSEDQNAGGGAIYVARVGGGFASVASATPCIGDVCQGASVLPPTEPVVGTSFPRSGDEVKNPRQGKRKCGKKRKRKRGRCVLRKKHARANGGRNK
jgi:hypothetical protein